MIAYARNMDKQALLRLIMFLVMISCSNALLFYTYFENMNTVKEQIGVIS